MLSAKLHQLVVDQLPVSDRIIWTYSGSVDGKNRLYLPMGLAKQLDLDDSKEFTSIFIDWKQPFLSLIPNKQRKIVEDVLAKNAFNKELSQDILYVLFGVQKISMDANNRISIPDIARSTVISSPSVYCIWYFNQIRIYSSDVYQTLVQKYQR